MKERTGKEHTMKRIAIVTGIVVVLGISPSVAGAANVVQVSKIQIAKGQVAQVQRATAQRAAVQRASAQRVSAQRVSVKRANLHRISPLIRTQR